MQTETRPNPKLTPIHRDPTFYVLLLISLPGILAAYLAALHGLRTGEFDGEQFLNAAFALPIVAYLGVFRQFPRAKSVEQIGQIEQARIQNDVMDGGPLVMSPMFDGPEATAEEIEAARERLKGMFDGQQERSEAITEVVDEAFAQTAQHFPSGDDEGVTVTLPDGEVVHGVTQDFADKLIEAQFAAGPKEDTGTEPITDQPADAATNIAETTPDMPYDQPVNGEEIR